MFRCTLVTAACAASLLVACGGSTEPPAVPASTEGANVAPTPVADPATTPANPSNPAGSPADALGAKEGETCGDGMLGRPNIACTSGLVCDLKGPLTTPPGAQGSAPFGTCKKP